MLARLGRMIAAPASVVVLIAFVLPWITVSCTVTDAEYSGQDIATGNIKPDELARLVDVLGKAPEGNNVVRLIPIAAGIVLGLFLLTAFVPAVEKLAGLSSALAGLAGLRVMWGVHTALQEGLATARKNGDFLGLVRLRYELGWWLTIGGLSGMVIGGVLMSLAKQRRNG